LETESKIVKCEFSFPAATNSLAQDLIGRILVPAKDRISVQEIAAHEFVRKHMSSKYFSPTDRRVVLLALNGPVERD
jgi:hypothetical protein